MIDINTLTTEDLDRKVMYTSHEGAPLEAGRITSWNDKYIFVDYSNQGRGQATPPSKLSFTYERIDRI